MSLSADVRVFDDYVQLEVSGDYGSGSLLELGDLVAKASEQHQRDKVLLDLRPVEGIIGNMDRFAAGVYGSQVWKTSLRTAVVLRPEALDRFFVNTAYNRGVQTLVVSTSAEAKSWLGV